MTSYGMDPGGGSTADQVKEQVGQQAQAAQERARGAAAQARGRFAEQVDWRSTQAGEQLAANAADVRSVAEELRRQGKETPARLAEQVAGQADRAAAYLKGANGERILRDAEDFARSYPWAVAAGGLALGFAASRLLKASSSRRYQASSFDTGDRLARPVVPAYQAPEPGVPPDGGPLPGTYEPGPAGTTGVPPVVGPPRPTAE